MIGEKDSIGDLVSEAERRLRKEAIFALDSDPARKSTRKAIRDLSRRSGYDVRLRCLDLIKFEEELNSADVEEEVRHEVEAGIVLCRGLRRLLKPRMWLLQMELDYR